MKTECLNRACAWNYCENCEYSFKKNEVCEARILSENNYIGVNSKLIRDIILNKNLDEALKTTIAKIKYDNNELKSQVITDSRCQFKQGSSELSLLGFINGILPELTGKVLVQNIDDNGVVTGYEIKEKWW